MYHSHLIRLLLYIYTSDMGQVDHSKTGQVDHRVNLPRISLNICIC